MIRFAGKREPFALPDGRVVEITILRVPRDMNNSEVASINWSHAELAWTVIAERQRAVNCFRIEAS